MKKTILFLLPIVVFCLFGCRNKDVAVIGGQDGPAKIYISDKTDNTEYSKNPVKILKIDGNLYYETNKFSEADGRCGNADGSFKKTADEFEIPKNNGESNFSEADSYQVGIEENTLEIRMDNGWKVFEKIDTNLVLLKSYIETEEHDETIREINELAFLVKHIEEKYAFNLKNIF